MGPSVKFVSRIDVSFSKKLLVNFFLGKKGKPGGGGPRGVCQKVTIFPFFSFSEPFPYPALVRMSTMSPAACFEREDLHGIMKVYKVYRNVCI